MLTACCIKPQVGEDTFVVDGYGAPSKGKGKGKGRGAYSCWQIKLGGNWSEYGNQENAILKRAYMCGQKNCKFELRGQKYEYNFKKMTQKNRDTKKERQIRPPRGPRPPAKPILPPGPMVVITVGSGQPGTTINIPDPNNPGTTLQVYVPPHAQPGQKMAVPIPGKGESEATVQKKQEEHDKANGTKTSAAGWSTGAKMAAGGAAVGGLAVVGVGGVILGDHLAGGDMAATIGESAADAVDAAGDGISDAADAAAPHLEAAGEWAAGAGEDAGEWIAGAAEDAGEWLGDAGEDIGDFVMDLF